MIVIDRTVFCALALLLICSTLISAAENVDHAAMIRSMDSAAAEHGKQVYTSICFACHGLDGRQPTNPQAVSFATGQFKQGNDPYSMFRTVTDGFNTMPSHSFLTPRQRYDAICYVRETFLKKDNPSQYFKVTEAYLASLPKPDKQAAEKVDEERDYGPVLGSQLGNSVNNGLSFRLQGDVTFNYDLHRMRSGGVWTGGFLNLSETQHYAQRGERMPQRKGDLIDGLQEYAWQMGGSWDILSDAKPPRGPVRRDWLDYHGYYLYGHSAVLSYAIEGREILETVGVDRSPELLVLHHTFRIEPGDRPTFLAVAQLGDRDEPAGLTNPGMTDLAGTSGAADKRIAVVTGKPHASSGGKPRFISDAEQGATLDLGNTCTVMVRFRTHDDGTLIATAPATGKWKPNGKALFIRGGHLVFDIGWVGAMKGRTQVDDDKWHTATLIVTPELTELYVDGQLDARRTTFRRDHVEGQVFKIGDTATNFGGPFTGDIERVAYYGQAMQPEQLTKAAQGQGSKPQFTWSPSPTPASSAKVQTTLTPYAAAAVVGDTQGLIWSIDANHRIVLTIPPSKNVRVFRVLRTAGQSDADLIRFGQYVTFAAAQTKVVDPKSMTRGGDPRRWPELLNVKGSLGNAINGYALDTIPVPFENPWNAWLRTSAVDFFPDGRAVVTTYGGDVYIVSGIDQTLGHVTWSRFAAGLFEPFGVKVVNGVIYVTCRDGIKRLHDEDYNGEADFVEAFYLDTDVSCSFHAFNFDLQTDSAGNFYFAKAGQYTSYSIPGAVLRVPCSGGDSEIVSYGIRTPNGMGALPGDRMTVSDNQGPWMPAGKINLVRPGHVDFYGNMPFNNNQVAWLKERNGGSLPTRFEQPIIWMPQDLDNSCGGEVWVDDPRWGPLSGRLIHSSYGKGWLYYMSLQDVGDKTQASIVALPHQWDAGVMRLRVNPHDGQIYGTGLSGWQGPPGGKDGCLQRLRYTGQLVRIIDHTRVTPTGLELTFNFPLDPTTANSPDAWMAELWNYFWSSKYGSDQFSVLHPHEKGHDNLRIVNITLSDDHRTVHLDLADLAVCDQLLLHMKIKDAAGEAFSEKIYYTIRAIPDQ